METLAYVGWSNMTARQAADEFAKEHFDGQERRVCRFVPVGGPCEEAEFSLVGGGRRYRIM